MTADIRRRVVRSGAALVLAGALSSTVSPTIPRWREVCFRRVDENHSGQTQARRSSRPPWKPYTNPENLRT
jgi:hypothetical protein